MTYSARLASILCLIALFGFSGVADAQTFRGGISGRIADTTGAVLPGVTVTATNDATGMRGRPSRPPLATSRSRICNLACTRSRPACRASKL